MILSYSSNNLGDLVLTCVFVLSFSVANRYNVDTELMWEYLAQSISLDNFHMYYSPLEFIKYKVEQYMAVEKSILVKDGTFDLKAVIDAVSVNLNETIMNQALCRWGGENVALSCDPNFFEMIITKYGRCFSIGYNMTKAGRTFQQNRAGSGSGFVVAVDIAHHDYAGILYHYKLKT